MSVARKDRPRAPRMSVQKRLELKIEGLRAEVDASLRFVGRNRAPGETADGPTHERRASQKIAQIVTALKLPRFVRAALGFKITSAFMAPDAFAGNADRLMAHDLAEVAVYRAVQAETTNVAERERYERMLASCLGACAGHLFRANELDAEA